MEHESDDTLEARRIVRMQRLREGKKPLDEPTDFSLLAEFQDSVMDFSSLGGLDFPASSASILS